MPDSFSASVRDRSSSRPPSSSSAAVRPMSSFTFSQRPPRFASRSRAISPSDSPTAQDSDLLTKNKPRLPPTTSRVAPVSAVIFSIALAFFLFGIFVSTHIAAIVLPTPANSFPATSHSEHAPHPPPQLNNSSAPLIRPGHHPSHSEQRQPVAASVPSSDDAQPTRHTLASQPTHVAATPENPRVLSDNSHSSPLTHSQHPPPAPSAAANPNPEHFPVGFKRSWPSSALVDHTHLIPLAASLSFTNNTLLDYFHMHKTGGVTTKVQLITLMDRKENSLLSTKRGGPMKHVETCYQVPTQDIGYSSPESQWRCDFGQIRNLTQQQYASTDLLMGHQYWEKGCDYYFGKARQVRYFSIFRHPLPRKLSFFYHFFIRNAGRNETQASKDEVIRFLLADDIADDPRSRDAGPNYYASRMLSDGMSGFVHNQYSIPPEKQDQALSTVLGRLETRFAFIGLQIQTEASQCMLQKTIQVLAHAHGIDNLVGTTKLAEGKSRLNAGGYSWTPQKIWAAMTPEQRVKYKQVERVDLAIYDKAVEIFKREVKRFSCQHRVLEEQWSDDVFH